MKKFKVYRKFEEKVIIWGMPIQMFFLYMAAIVVCLFMALSLKSWWILVPLGIIGIGGQLVAPFFVDSQRLKQLTQKKLPRKIRNDI